MYSVFDTEGRLMQRLKLLARYKPLVIKELLKLKNGERGGLTELAKRIQVDPSRLSEIMGNRRNLTSDYIVKMVAGGFIRVDQLIAGWKGSEIAPDEAAFLESLRIVEDREWVRLITELKKDPRAEQTAKNIVKTLIQK